MKHARLGAIIAICISIAVFVGEAWGALNPLEAWGA